MRNRGHTCRIRWRLGVFIPAFCILLACALAHAEEDARPGIVVWKLQANKGVDAADVNLISNFVANQVAKYSGSNIISEADIRTILRGEETRQQCGAEDTSCVAEIGAALGVPEAVSGDIGKIGDYWMLNLRRINVRSAAVIGRSSRNIRGDINVLIESLPQAVAELFGLQAGESPKVVVVKTTGTLFVSSDPKGCEVKIDGRSASRTPFEKKLNVGVHKVSVAHRGYHVLERELRIMPGQKLKEMFKLERITPGELSVKSSPSGATLRLDGIEKGVTPFRKIMEVGDYKLELQLDGYKTVEESVTVKSKKTTRLNFSLERDYPMNPYKKYGYVTFFTGVGLVAFGGIATWRASEAAADNKGGDWNAEGRNRAWSGLAIAGYTLGGAAMLTGVVLWVLSPSDREWAERRSVSAAPTPDDRGAVVSLEGRW